MSVSADVLRSQIAYTAWASLRLLQAAAELTPKELAHDFQTADRTIAGTLAHIYAGDRVWLARLTGAPAPDFMSDASRDLSALQSDWPELLEGWKTWAAGFTDQQVL